MTFLVPLLLALAAGGAGAQTIVAGPTLAGEPFDLATRGGRVVMLFLWDSRCAVCLSKMAELRANAQGWAGRPFDLVTINVDAERAPALAYEQARVAVKAGLPLALWAGEIRLPADLARPQRLPLTVVVDRQGREAWRVAGRIPPDLWDEVAALLP